jgi:hypothetical protein
MSQSHQEHIADTVFDDSLRSITDAPTDKDYMELAGLWGRTFGRLARFLRGCWADYLLLNVV